MEMGFKDMKLSTVACTLTEIEMFIMLPSSTSSTSSTLFCVQEVGEGGNKQNKTQNDGSML